jgi:hypothetical protein
LLVAVVFVAGFVGFERASAEQDVDHVPHWWESSLDWHGCVYTGTTYFDNDVPYAVATTDPQETPGCQSYPEYMYVALQFLGSDYQWHWYPSGWYPCASYIMVISEQYYWTDHAHGYHQMYHGLYGYSATAATDTD